MSSNEPSQGEGRSVLDLTLSYDGSRFAGSQRQANRRTVQAELERALGEFWGEEPDTVFAGRTDQGVHAAGQRVSVVDRRCDLPEHSVRNAINVRLPDDASVTTVGRKPNGFHARYDAIWREYRYRIWSGPRQALVAGSVMQRSVRFDRDAMQDAAAKLVGTKDLAAFAGDGEGVPWSSRQQAPRGTERTVLVCDVGCLRPWWGPVERDGDLIELRVAADGFLPKMVRNIAGALMMIGQGVRPVDWIEELVETRDRRQGGMTAPPHGLTLWRVGYPGDLLPEPERSARIG